MLQQTQVATVLGYYARFLQRFPDVTQLAQASEQEVLQLWAGLGYYRRARQLHAAAKLIVSELGGHFPAEVEQLEKLPGVGRYTAGAISSFAFDRPAPILEANTVRLFSRLISLRDEVKTHSSQQKLWQFATWILPPKKGTGELNQAVMELGSLICKPSEPNCDQCPINSLCPTFAQGLQLEIPNIACKQRTTPLRHVAAIIQFPAVSTVPRFLMRQCEDGQWWTGLWDFPRVDVSDSINQEMFDRYDSSTKLTIEHSFLTMLAVQTKLYARVARLRHSVTRYRIQLDCCIASISNEGQQFPSDHWRWLSRAEALDLPLTSTAKKIWQAHL